MTERKLAKKHGVHYSYINLIKHQHRFTSDIDLAKDVAKLSGRAPIDHISLKWRKMILRLYPELKKRNGKNR
jgi:hypothetical protein